MAGALGVALGFGVSLKLVPISAASMCCLLVTAATRLFMAASVNLGVLFVGALTIKPYYLGSI